jgi:hypothetical protein
MFCQNYNTTFTTAQEWPKIWTPSVIFKKLPKVNIRPIWSPYRRQATHDL